MRLIPLCRCVYIIAATLPSVVVVASERLVISRPTPTSPGVLLALPAAVPSPSAAQIRITPPAVAVVRSSNQLSQPAQSLLLTGAPLIPLRKTIALRNLISRSFSIAARVVQVRANQRSTCSNCLKKKITLKRGTRLKTAISYSKYEYKKNYCCLTIFFLVHFAYSSLLLILSMCVCVEFVLFVLLFQEKKTKQKQRHCDFVLLL